jgi:TonB-dependent starch-binding outer membrane protein SusC
MNYSNFRRPPDHSWGKFLLLVISSFLFLQVSFAQTREVSGVVTSEKDGIGIPGVTVANKTTGTGIISVLNGNYSIAASEGDVIEFSFVGKISQRVTVTTDAVINISMKEDLIGLDEVIVIGYGTQKKADVSSAIATVSSGELANKPVSNFEQSLQGVSAGVSVTGNRGAPGEGAIIRIRGVGSINNTNPLIVIDGISTDGTLSLDPLDIASVQVLKDAAAAAIYGARGANGVVLITTKKGKTGDPKFTFEAYNGIQSAWRTLDLLDAEDYCKLVIENNYNISKKPSPIAARDPYDSLNNNTDWQKAMFRSAPIKKYNLSASGGTDKSSYYVSGGYFSQDGIMIGTKYENYHLRINNDVKSGRFSFGETLSLNFTKKENEPTSGDRSQIEQILKMPPLVPIYDPTALGGFAGPTTDDGHDGVNPVGVAGTHLGKDGKKSIVGSIFAGIEIVKGLNFESRLGVDYNNTESSYLLRAHQMGVAGGVAETYLKNTNSSAANLVFENTLTFLRDFGKHSVKLLAGYTAEDGYREYVMASREGFTVDGMTLHAGYGEIMNDGERYESSLLSQLGRLEYGYDQRYYLTANIRRDGSSKFGPVSRWGIFPSASAAWRINNESFMQNVKLISDLKLRASYGKIGNQDIGDYGSEASLSSYFNYVLNDIVVTGIGPDIFPNTAIHWETTKQTDIGFDLGMFSNKLYLTTDIYKKQTEEMLVKVPIPGSNGFSGASPYQNSGSVLNKGLEMMLTYREYKGSFKYSVSGNFAYNYNEVLGIGDGGVPIVSGTVENEKGGITKTDIGYPIGSFYLYKTNGLYHNQAEIDAMNLLKPDGTYTKFAPSAKPGDVRYVDVNGDGLLTSADRVMCGSPIPKFEMGLNITAEYMGFDLNLFFQGVFGNKIYNENRLWTEGMFGNWNASSEVLNRYRADSITILSKRGDGRIVSIFYPADTTTSMPRAVATDPNKNALRGSDRFLEDGSYLRLKTITLGYSFPKQTTDRIKLTKLRIYITAQNLLTFTRYTGYDPEIGSNPIGDSNGPVNLARGIDNGYYPQARTILGGIQIGF